MIEPTELVTLTRIQPLDVIEFQENLESRLWTWFKSFAYFRDYGELPIPGIGRKVDNVLRLKHCSQWNRLDSSHFTSSAPKQFGESKFWTKAWKALKAWTKTMPLFGTLPLPLVFLLAVNRVVPFIDDVTFLQNKCLNWKAQLI